MKTMSLQGLYTDGICGIVSKSSTPQTTQMGIGPRMEEDTGHTMEHYSGRRRDQPLILATARKHTEQLQNLRAEWKKDDKKTKTKCTDPTVLLLGIHLRELKTGVQRNPCTCMFIAAQFTTAKKVETTQVSTS